MYCTCLNKQNSAFSKRWQDSQTILIWENKINENIGYLAIQLTQKGIWYFVNDVNCKRMLLVAASWASETCSVQSKGWLQLCREMELFELQCHLHLLTVQNLLPISSLKKKILLRLLHIPISKVWDSSRVCVTIYFLSSTYVLETKTAVWLHYYGSNCIRETRAENIDKRLQLSLHEGTGKQNDLFLYT